jgi:hypothetical protein
MADSLLGVSRKPLKEGGAQRDRIEKCRVGPLTERNGAAQAERRPGGPARPSNVIAAGGGLESRETSRDIRARRAREHSPDPPVVASRLLASIGLFAREVCSAQGRRPDARSPVEPLPALGLVTL